MKYKKEVWAEYCPNLVYTNATMPSNFT